MSYEDLVTTATWKRYSKKLAEKIISARNGGYFTSEDACSREMRCAEGRAGSVLEGSAAAFYLLVDALDGMIVDAKFQVFGPAHLIAAADILCELVIGKNYDQAKRIGAELIDKKVRDMPEVWAFPEETRNSLNLVIEALDIAVAGCADIPLSETYVSPVPQNEGGGEGYPGWLELSYEKKLAVIEEILNVEVRPYVELDAGGIEVQQLIDDKELVIAYQGSCTSCYSAIGTTLSTIQHIVQTKVHPSITVVPNMDSLALH